MNIIPINKHSLKTWLVDSCGNIAVSGAGMALLERINNFLVPTFDSTEQAMEWGSHLNAGQHDILVDKQRTLSNAALVECNPQYMVNLATQSQLLREAAEAFTPTRVL